jgi:hypothetical protein
VGREPLGVGPGDRSEPLEELGWLPPGETTGLEPLRPKILMMATTARGVCWRSAGVGALADGECRATVGRSRAFKEIHK